MALVDHIYTFVLWLLSLYKVLNLCLMKLVEPKVKAIVLKTFKDVGVQVIVETNNNEKGKGKGDLTVKNGTTTNGVNGVNGQTNGHSGGPIMTIHDPRFFVRLAGDREMGLGESYMDGWWDCDRLDQLCELFLRNGVDGVGRYPWEKLTHYLEYSLFNLQTRSRAYQVAEGHYDLGNELYEAMLDKTMTYTCAYWKGANNLEEAQIAKLDLVARKLQLKPGMRVLELGCGWGALAHYLADKYKVTVVACNIATEGVKTAQEKCKGLPVTILCKDYREMTGKFDRVVSIGMIEHVGPKNYETMFEVARQCLDDEGIFLVHTIGVDDAKMGRDHPWSNKYIFPNAVLPRATELTEVASKYFILEDWQSFGHDYSRTLMAWHENFAQNWHTIKHHFDNPTRFYRMWSYYLLMTAGSFRARKLQLWQLVMSKNGIKGRYDAPR